jgi:hypothetical protein
MTPGISSEQMLKICAEIAGMYLVYPDGDGGYDTDKMRTFFLNVESAAWEWGGQINMVEGLELRAAVRRSAQPVE